jgi:trigger factor
MSQTTSDYKVDIETTGEISRSINIEIPRAVYQSRFSKALNATSKKAAIKGFRPGKVPMKVVEKLYGPQIRHEVLSEITAEAYDSAVKQHELEVVGRPAIDFQDEKEGEDLKIVANIEILPRPKITGYSELTLEAEVVEASEEEFQESVKQFLQSHAKFEQIKDRTVIAEGDIVKLSYDGKSDGNELQGASAKGVFLELGKGTMPELEEKLAGVELNKETVIEVDYSSDSPKANLAGKQVQYTVTADSIYARTIPELSDELAVASGLAQTVDELKTSLRSSYDKDVEQRNKTSREAALFAAIQEKNPFEIPQVMIDEEIRSILFEMRLLDSRKRESYNVDVTRFREPLGESATGRVQKLIVLDRIIEQEKFSVADQDIEAWLDSLAAEHKQSREDINRFVGYPARLDNLKTALGREKMIDKLLESATIKEKKTAAKSEEKSPKKKAAKKKAE